MPGERQHNPDLISNANCEVVLSLFSYLLFRTSSVRGAISLSPCLSLDIYFLSPDGINIRDSSVSTYDMGGAAATWEIHGILNAGQIFQLLTGQPLSL